MNENAPDLTPPGISMVCFLIGLAVLKKRPQQRRLALAYLLCLGGWLVWAGDSWLINQIPAKLIGYGIGLLGMTGLSGVNIWRGGPLDPNNDKDDANVSSAPPSASSD